MVKKKLFLDVDGVLNVFAEGYENRSVEVDGENFPHLLYPSEHTLPFMRWAWETFDVRWCTAWGEAANRISDWAKLPHRPIAANVRSKSAEWKLDAVRSEVQGSRAAAVWVEDGIGKVADAWVARKKNFFYIHTQFRVGVTRDHAACLADWMGLSMEAWK